ncbi:MAG: hypothetical protein NTZ05_14095 [Chloroflexi bacterium]|nr:hypothetical protein [Chloroflexota bacterium]
MGRIFLANVGANAGHRMRSPLFADGTFEFVTIPEPPGAAPPPMLRYSDPPCFNDRVRPLTDYLPAAARDQYTHADPEFTTFTYGDLGERNPRATGLRSLRPGDFLFFPARLTPWSGGAFHGVPGFFLVCFLEIAESVGPVWSRPEAAALARIVGNAHVRRGLVGPTAFDGTDHSSRLPHAVPVPARRRTPVRGMRGARRGGGTAAAKRRLSARTHEPAGG